MKTYLLLVSLSAIFIGCEYPNSDDSQPGWIIQPDSTIIDTLSMQLSKSESGNIGTCQWSKTEKTYNNLKMRCLSYRCPTAITNQISIREKGSLKVIYSIFKSYLTTNIKGKDIFVRKEKYYRFDMDSTVYIRVDTISDLSTQTPMNNDFSINSINKADLDGINLIN